MLGLQPALLLRRAFTLRGLCVLESQMQWELFWGTLHHIVRILGSHWKCSPALCFASSFCVLCFRFATEVAHPHANMIWGNSFYICNYKMVTPIILGIRCLLRKTCCFVMRACGPHYLPQQAAPDVPPFTHFVRFAHYLGTSA